MSDLPLAETSSVRRSYRVLHVLDHSLPVLSGYSIRSKSIVEAQQKLGHRVQVLTGTAHQLDDPTADDTVLNGIPYARTALPNNLRGRAITRRWPLLREISAIWLLRRRILGVLDGAAFDVIHAHSPSLCRVAPGAPPQRGTFLLGTRFADSGRNPLSTKTEFGGTLCATA
jgi:glycosyl transferase family 4